MSPTSLPSLSCSAPQTPRPPLPKKRPGWSRTKKISRKNPAKSIPASASGGICHLVGAGPGDPGLITLRGRDCLEQAEVVLYDYLSNAELLRHVPAGAEIIYAGKTAGRHALKQEETNALLVKHTAAGKRVVRLKGGAPFLFGRGGEEAQALAAAGLRFEIVPGVTSAIGGLAYAGIPVTHRASNAVLTIFTGHEEPGKEASGIDYKAIASAPGTKVMLMGVERLGPITEQLGDAGRDRRDRDLHHHDEDSPGADARGETHRLAPGGDGVRPDDLRGER